MVKETKYDHHPMRVVKGLALGTEQVFGGIIVLDMQAAVMATIAGSNSTGWYHLDLGAYAPADARAAILDIAVNDSGAATGGEFLEVGYPGVILSTKTQLVYPGDLDAPGSRLVIAVLNDDDKVNLKITASGAVFDGTIKLIGWVLDPYVAKVTPPSVDMSCTFVVNQ